MSYTLRDLLQDQMGEDVVAPLVGDKYPDKLQHVVMAVVDYQAEKNAAAIWEVLDEWCQTHVTPDYAPGDYVNGVAAGLKMAARELEA